VGSVVTQTVLGGLNIHSSVTSFIQFTCAKKSAESIDKVIAMKTMCSFFGPHCYKRFVAA